MKLSLNLCARRLLLLSAVPATLLVEASTTINVDHTQVYQEFYGCGASWTDSSAWVVNGFRANPSTDPRTLSTQERTEIMDSLFRKDCDGCIGLDILRQPMGTSDFRWSDYTYEDTRGQFTIGQDLSYIVPTILDSIGLNPDVKVMGIPWSPPAWAKTNNNLNGGQLKAYDATTMADYYDYFVKFVNAYEAQGIPIWALSVQNEPQHESGDYPTMTMSFTDHGKLIEGVRTALDGANHGDIKVVGYDHNWDTPWYVTNLMDNASFDRASVSAIGFHCYAGDVSTQTQIKNKYPDVEIFFTECTEHGQVGSFNQDFRWALANLVIGATRNWASTVIEWNMVLFDGGGPKASGGCSNCRGLIDIFSSGYVKNPAFYALGHVSKFVKVGAKRISSDQPTGNTKTLAMLNPDNSSFLVILNDGSPDMTYDISGWLGADCPGLFVRSWSAVTLYRNAGSSTSAQVWRTTDQDINVRLKYTEDLTCTPIPGAPTLAPVPVATEAPVPPPVATEAPAPAPVAPVATEAPAAAPVAAPFSCPPVNPPAPQCSTEMKASIQKMAEECGMIVTEQA